MSADVVVNFRVSPDILSVVDAAAERHSLTRSGLIRLALLEYLMNSKTLR